jgi:hypothetical protein
MKMVFRVSRIVRQESDKRKETSLLTATESTKKSHQLFSGGYQFK